MSESSEEKPYRFWLPFCVDVLKFFVEVGIAFGILFLSQRIANLESQPLLKQIGEMRQFPAEDGIRTIRLKNFSSRQDAVVTGVEFVVSEREFLDRINKRDRYEKGPPIPWAENIIPREKTIEFLQGEWDYDGTRYRFKQEVDLRIEPGKAELLRLTIVNPKGLPTLWDHAWMEGDLIVAYDDKKTRIERVIIVHKDTERDPNIPPKW